jgi:hypothetical protein
MEALMARTGLKAMLKRDAQETLEFIQMRMEMNQGVGVPAQEVKDMWRKRGGGHTWGSTMLAMLVSEGRVEYEPITKVITRVNGVEGEETKDSSCCDNPDCDGGHVGGTDPEGGIY